MLIDRVRDATQRYNGMYGFHGKDYIKVVDVGGSDSNIIISIIKQGGKKVEEVPLAELNMTKFEFGFMFNHKTNMGFFASKSPRRETRQGIDYNFIQLDSMTNDKYRQPNYKDNLIKTEGFAAMLSGVFNFDKGRMDYLAQKSVEEGHEPTHFPLSKNFSIRPSSEIPSLLTLTYLGEQVVGVWDKEKVILPKGMECFEGQLKRAGIEIK